MVARNSTHVFTLAKALLFFSGVAALVYQAIWIKQLTLVVGVDVYAITIGVSGFFAGLAAGSALFGHIADRMDKPLRLYLFLELGIAVLGVTATVALAGAPAVFVALQSAVGLLAWILPFGLVAIPATLMGGTLPPLLAAVRPDAHSVGHHSGQLYAANTAGAIVGALLTVFLVVPTYGIRGASMFAASLNLLLAVSAFIVLSRGSSRPETIEAPKVQATVVPPSARLALGLYAIAGGIAIGYEVVWTQIIVQFLSTRAVAFSVVLATYLLGLVLGSWLFARFADRVAARWSAFGWLIAGAGIAAIATFGLLGPWLPEAQSALGGAVRELTGSRMLEMCVRFAFAASVLILPATLLLGAAFPAAARLIVQSQHAGRDVGYVLALNTACGILGSIVTGFVLIPALGLAGSLGALAFCAAVIGGVAIAKQTDFKSMAPRWAVVMVIIVAGAAIILPRDRLATMLADARGGEVVFYDEGPAGTVAVIEQATSKGTFRRLYIQGVSNSGDVMPSKRYMRLQGLLPLMIHSGEPKSAMVIAFGTGITAGSLLAYPGLERRLVVELLQPVVDAAELFEGNYGAGSDPRLEVVVADGRHELMRREEAFDLITLEPPPPAAAGVVNLYSRDFYELAAKRLNNSGMLAQWLPIATQNDEDTQSLVRSMLDIFPYVMMWTTEVHEMMLIGSMQPMPLDYSQIAGRMSAPETATALREVGINSAADLLATYITDQTGLEQYASRALPVTDDRPRIEYAPWVRPKEIIRVLPKLLGLGSPLPLAASQEQIEEVEQSYFNLLDFYEAVYRSYGDDRNSWAERKLDLNKSGEPNAYYDWFFSSP
ncbi:MAG: spermidine synthase [Woeseiaceae bacterium]